MKNFNVGDVEIEMNESDEHARPSIKRPFMLNIVLFCNYAGIIIPSICAVLYFSLGGTLQGNEKEFGREEFFELIYNNLLFFAILWGYSIFLAEGLRRNGPWTRPLLMGGALISCVTSLGIIIIESFDSSRIAELIGNGIIAAIIYWYLFKRDGTVRYYDSIKRT